MPDPLHPEPPSTATGRMTRRAWLAASLSSLAGCSAFDVLNAWSKGGPDAVESGVPYGEHPRQKLDIYPPAQPIPGPARAVVFFYGGSWREGERRDYAFVGRALAARGFTGVVADYRLYPEVRYPEFLRDCAAATARAASWFRQQGHADARLFVAGHSAGAYNAAMLATDPRWLGEHGLAPSALAGWIGIAGPYNFLPIQDPDVQPVFDHPNVPPDSQPIAHVGRAALPPALLLTGEQDTYVNIARNTLALADRLATFQHTVALKVYPQLSHKSVLAAIARPLQFLGPVITDIADFVATG